MIIPIGSIINALSILVGGSIGLVLYGKFSNKIQHIVFQAIGLCVLLVGLQMALKAEQIIVIIFSFLIGGIIGESVDLEDKLEKLGNIIKNKVKSSSTTFTEGFVVSSILMCVGAMAIVGSLNEGLQGDRSILLTKSVLDGAVSVAFASTYGVGVLFSALPILLYEGLLTILASYMKPLLTPSVLNQLSSTGGLLIIGVAMNILEIKKIKVMNLIPSLILVVLFTIILKGVGL